MPETQTRRREYETIYVLRPTASREASMDIEKRVNEILGRHGSSLTQVENWGRRRLAYQVQKHHRGIYIYLKYQGAGQVVSELERTLRLADDVMKFQTVKLSDIASGEASEAVEFEHFDGANIPEEEDESLAKQLGLEGRGGPRRDDGRDEDSNDGRDGDEDNEAKAGDSSAQSDESQKAAAPQESEARADDSDAEKKEDET